MLDFHCIRCGERHGILSGLLAQRRTRPCCDRPTVVRTHYLNR